jgi:hypothetical protein
MTPKFKVGDRIVANGVCVAGEKVVEHGMVFKVLETNGDPWPYSIRGLIPEHGWSQAFIENNFELYIEIEDRE